MGRVRRPAVVASAAVAVTVAIGYAWVAAGLRPFTAPALVATLAGGLVAIAVGVRLAPSAPPTRDRPAGGTRWWALGAVAVAIWQLQAFVQHPRSQHPTISSLTNVLLADHPSRTAAMAAWLAAGVWLARR